MQDETIKYILSFETQWMEMNLHFSQRLCLIISIGFHVTLFLELHFLQFYFWICIVKYFKPIYVVKNNDWSSPQGKLNNIGIAILVHSELNRRTEEPWVCVSYYTQIKICWYNGICYGHYTFYQQNSLVWCGINNKTLPHTCPCL